MEILINRQIILKTAAAWFLITVIMGTMCTLLISIGSPVRPVLLFISGQIMTSSIIVPPVLTGYWAGYRLRNEKFMVIIRRMLPLTTVATTIGWGAGYTLVRKILQIMPDFSFHDSIIRIYIPSLIFNLFFTSITPAIELLRRQREQLKNETEKISSAVEKLDAK